MIKRILFIGSASFIVLLFLVYVIINNKQESLVMNGVAREQAPGKFITLSDGVTHYQRLGTQQDTTLLFIHGGGITGSELWQQNADYFSNKGYDVLLYDLYGRGYSDRIAIEHTPALFSRQLTELLDSLQIRGPLNIISMSMGSLVALDFVTQNSGSVHTITMIDPAITGDYRANPLLKIPVVSNLLMTFYWYPRAIENQRKEFVNQQIFETYSKRLKYFSDFAGYKQTNYSTWMHMLNQSKLHVLSTLAKNKVLLVYGSQDPYFSKQNASLLSQTYPSLRIEAIENTGHMPHVEKPAAVNAIIDKFLTAPEQ
jgi:pimeloyl-ACP methyl ester carboxylesterase